MQQITEVLHSLKALDMVGATPTTADVKQYIQLLEEATAKPLKTKKKEENKPKPIIPVKKEFTVTEHATVRALERMAGFNIAELKADLKLRVIAKYGKSVPDGKYQLGHYTAVVRGNALVTII